MQWLVASLVLSVLLTVLLNVVVRMFPNAGRRSAERLDALTRPNPTEPSHTDRTVRVIAPWKAMVLTSVVLTVVVNIALWLFR